MGLFPGILGAERLGGVWLSESRDGVRWSSPLRLLEAPIRPDGRTDLHPVGGFAAAGDGTLRFLVDHNIIMTASKCCEPDDYPFTCEYTFTPD